MEGQEEVKTLKEPRPRRRKSVCVTCLRRTRLLIPFMNWKTDQGNNTTALLSFTVAGVNTDKNQFGREESLFFLVKVHC